MSVTLSVCIPAYNRAELLVDLMESILSQDFDSYEIVICEDLSPQREMIRSIMQRYININPKRIRYFENDQNLGYDANLRNLIEKSIGAYCFFMGNDDLMCAGALKTVASALDRYHNVGVVLRSYASFNGSPDNINQIFRYFDREIFFPAGPKTIATFYRRSVVIPGVVINRSAALKYSTDRFDGSLLYQLFLVANILVDMNGLFIPDILVLYRNGGIPDFGNSEKEQGKFVPEDQTPESSLHFMRGMLEIAKWIDNSRNIPIYKSILNDIANYSYPIIAIQSHRKLTIFIKYVYQLARLGFWRSSMFFAYFFSIFILGSNRVDVLIRFVKQRLGYTPAIGSVYKGEIV